MALLDSEVDRLRYELGYNLLTVGAEPWINIASAFSNVIQIYVRSGATTTSSTTVTAATTPTPITLTLASGVGFSTGDMVVVDVDSRQEIVTAQLVSSNSLTVLLSKVHSGTFPVTVSRGEAIIRDILNKLRNISDKLQSSATKAGIKRVDEIEFFGDSRTDTVFSNLKRQREYWRDELSSAVGLARRNHSGSGACVSVY